MSERTLPRPPQVTFSGWVILVGSIFVLFSVYDTVANLRSIETRESVQRMISEPPLEGMGVGLQEMLDLMHASALVAGGCAAATAILGAYVLRRNTSALVGVSVLALPLLLAGMVAGGFASSMVAVAVVLLWTRPSRDWFAGRTPPKPLRAPAAGAGAEQRPTQAERPAWPPASPPRPYVDDPGAGGPEQGAEPSGEPRSYSGFGTVPTVPTHVGARSHRPQDPTRERPRELVAACVMTWVFSGLVLISMVVGLVVLSADDSVVREMHEGDSRFADAGISVATLQTTAVVTCILFAVWALVAVVLAALAHSGHNWARWVLFASAITTAFVTLLAMISAPVVLVLTGAAAYVAVLLTRPPVTTWLNRPRNRP